MIYLDYNATTPVDPRVLAEMLPMFDDGRLRPVVVRVFPFDEIAAAHEVMSSNANVGKLVVQVR